MSKLIEQLKRHEGFRSEPYKDTVDKLTVGYGRNLDDVGISKEEAEFMLMNDADIAKNQLSERFEWFNELDRVRQDVLVNMVFNLGLHRFLEFKKTIAFIEAGRYAKASNEMLDSRWARQIKDRALELSRQMLSGEYQV